MDRTGMVGMERSTMNSDKDYDAAIEESIARMDRGRRRRCLNCRNAVVQRSKSSIPDAICSAGRWKQAYMLPMVLKGAHGEMKHQGLCPEWRA